MLTRLSKIDFSSEISRLTKDFMGRQWVFDDLDDWLTKDEGRFFILTGEPGVGKSAIAAQLTKINKDIAAYHFCVADNLNTLKPGQILRSLSAQLMETLPGYAQALINTIKSPTLAVKVNITYEEANNSDIKDIFIENLKFENEGKDGQEDLDSLLEVLIRAPLMTLANYQESLPEVAILLFDGLDIAVSRKEAAQDDEDIVTLLATLVEAESFPPWLRFIFTTRLDRRLLREFEPFQELDIVQTKHVNAEGVILPSCLYKIDELSEDNQTDISDYIQTRIQQQPLESLLSTLLISSQTLVDSLLKKAEGNFLYARCILDDLNTEILSNQNKLPYLPKKLAHIYAQEWFTTADDKDQYLLILNKLSEEEDFTSEDTLVRLTKLRPRIVRQALWGLRQFLDIKKILVNPEKEIEGFIESFAIFHPSFREYLDTCDL